MPKGKIIVKVPVFKHGLIEVTESDGDTEIPEGRKLYFHAEFHPVKNKEYNFQKEYFLGFTIAKVLP